MLCSFQSSAQELVVARAAVDDVGALLGVELVVAVAAVDRVGADAAGDLVVAVAADERVRVRGERGAAQHVVAAAAVERHGKAARQVVVDVELVVAVAAFDPDAADGMGHDTNAK